MNKERMCYCKWCGEITKSALWKDDGDGMCDEGCCDKLLCPLCGKSSTFECVD